MLSKKIYKMLLEQITRELDSSHLYLAAAAHLDAKGLPGMAHWMKVQSEEEREHAMKIYKYLDDLDLEVTFDALRKPVIKASTALEVFEIALSQEKALTGKISEIAAAALAEKDHMTYTFLGWFLNEQVEEISVCTDVIDKLTLVGDEQEGIYLVDRELEKRSA